MFWLSNPAKESNAFLPIASPKQISLPRGCAQAKKVMNKQGEMTVRNVNDTIADIFEITGFSDILTIE